MSKRKITAIIMFSLIIPTYNERRYIEPCLQSILHQNFPRGRFEIIVADSQSPDGTAQVAARHADKVLSIPRRGIAHARNAGAQQANGDILLFVDADVKLEPGFLSGIERAFSEDGVVGVTGKGVPEGGTLFARFVYHGTYTLVRFFLWFGLPLFPGLCVAYRRQDFEAVGGFREDFGVTEDLDLSRRISARGKCRYLPQARALVSTRRLEKHAVSTVLFHIYHDIRYLLTGKAPRVYPKHEEIQSGRDLWKVNS